MRKKRFNKKPSMWLYYGLVVAIALGAILLVAFFTVYSFESFVSSQLEQGSLQITGSSEQLHADIRDLVREISLYCLSFAGVVALVISGLSYLLYSGISSPLKEMEEGAKKLAEGKFDQKLPPYQLNEISELARAMNKMGEQLKWLEEVRRDFVANVSHELKTPITSIVGFVETLQAGAMDEREDLERFLEIIAQQSERLTLIIEDLLTLARLESGKIEDLLVPREEAVRDVLQAAVEAHRSLAQSRDIQINLECSEDIHAVMDRSLMEQAVGNLISNAIKYSGTDSTVFLRAETLQEYVEISVCDQGPGIAAEYLPRLFERFYRIDKARARGLGGTGLGLAIVKHIAGVHHGEVAVRSELGQGSTFLLRVPAQGN